MSDPSCEVRSRLKSLMREFGTTETYLVRAVFVEGVLYGRLHGSVKGEELRGLDKLES